jgi:DNA ligase (NAD+)
MIKAVVWQVGPLGTITPVAQVEPIELAGAVITYASLANHNLIIEKDLNTGDIIEISRRGDVIPHIEKVITKVNKGHIDIPRYCPSCHTKLIKDDKSLHCPNAGSCLDQILGSLRLFCDTLGILGLSDKTIAKLYQANRVRLPGDFFKLIIEDISDLDNLGDKSARSIINQLRSRQSLTLKQVFDAAIIPNFSAQRIQQVISAGYDTADKLLNITQKELEALPGFQTILAKKVFDGINLRRNWIVSVLSQISLKTPVSKIQKLSGLSFCITGDLNRPRKEIIDLIETFGGKVQSAVTSATSYLLTNELESSSSKFTAAKKLNITIINEEHLIGLLKD